MAFNFGNTSGIKKIGPMRRAQFIMSFGCGSIVNTPNCTAIVSSTDNWIIDKANTHRINEITLQRLLGVKYFNEPPSAPEWHNLHEQDIPAFRFPLMHFCPNCGTLKEYYRFTGSDGYVCKSCNKKLLPSRFMAACINGHLEDFPYAWWVHHNQEGKLIDNYNGTCDLHNYNSSLKIEFSSTSGGLDGIKIICLNCGATRTMAGSMSKGSLKGYFCNGNRPWLKDRDLVKCQAKMWGLQRGGSNIYFPVTESALTIPPWSSYLSDIIDSKWADVKYDLDAGDDIDTVIKSNFRREMKNGKCTLDELKEIVLDRYNGATQAYSKQIILEDEYSMLCNGTYDDDNFHIKCSTVPKPLQPFIQKLVEVHRLREVMALVGFRRIYPTGPDEVKDNPDDAKKFKGYNQKNGYTPLSKDALDWLPAIELFGEGIFIQFYADSVDQWVAANANRYENMRLALENSLVRCDNYTPEYVLLHTIAHLLIRQLSLECGYASASLRERIYCTYPDNGKPMYGILIYTSASDSDGSLGGLVRQGEEDAFSRIFLNMLEEATWCSSDPVCSEASAQGMDGLNYAACHACTLLPETSCERRNTLLDRVAVIGSFDKPEIGYFCSILNQAFPNQYHHIVPVVKPNLMNLKIDTSNAKSMQGYSDYKDIWKAVRSLAGDNYEKNKIQSFIDNSKYFDKKEKPYQNVIITIPETNEKLLCNLVWPNSKVLYFKSKKRADYEKCLSRDYVCFFGGDTNLTVTDIANAIK